MAKKKLIHEILGNDKFNVSWNVLIDETHLRASGQISFYVYDPVLRNKDVRDKPNYIMIATLRKISDQDYYLVDISHTIYEREELSFIEEFINESSEPPENYEDRGIGTLLLKRIEKWLIENKIKSIHGYLYDWDGPKKLEKNKHFYEKNGWIINIPATTTDLPHIIDKGIGITYKIFDID